ncbi:MAG: hypothetical protein MJZ74_08290 [Muribaculaceae bacterium]|nr:hypothetical protein [Muribaculaceae bacterium]
MMKLRFCIVALLMTVVVFPNCASVRNSQSKRKAHIENELLHEALKDLRGFKRANPELYALFLKVDKKSDDIEKLRPKLVRSFNKHYPNSPLKDYEKADSILSVIAEYINEYERFDYRCYAGSFVTVVHDCKVYNLEHEFKDRYPGSNAEIMAWRAFKVKMDAFVESKYSWPFTAISVLVNFYEDKASVFRTIRYNDLIALLKGKYCKQSSLLSSACENFIAQMEKPEYFDEEEFGLFFNVGESGVDFDYHEMYGKVQEAGLEVIPAFNDWVKVRKSLNISDSYTADVIKSLLEIQLY